MRHWFLAKSGIHFSVFFDFPANFKRSAVKFSLSHLLSFIFKDKFWEILRLFVVNLNFFHAIWKFKGSDLNHFWLQTEKKMREKILCFRSFHHEPLDFVCERKFFSSCWVFLFIYKNNQHVVEVFLELVREKESLKDEEREL